MWSVRKGLAVLSVLFVVSMLLGGAARSVHAAFGLPGSPFNGGQSPAVISGLVINENGQLVTLSETVFPGDIVLCETPGCSLSNPSSWSDVLRFCDTPLDDTACQNAVTGLTGVTHVQLFSSVNDGAGSAGFRDEFTGHTLDASKLTVNVGAIDENPTGPTNYNPGGNSYVVDSPEEAIPEYPIGLAVLVIFMVITYGLIKRRTRNTKNT